MLLHAVPSGGSTYRLRNELPLYGMSVRLSVGQSCIWVSVVLLSSLNNIIGYKEVCLSDFKLIFAIDYCKEMNIFEVKC